MDVLPRNRTRRALARCHATAVHIALAALVTLAGATGCSDSSGTSPATPQYATRGPYAVGLTTLDLGDREVDVFYPVDARDAEGAQTTSYASFEVLPEAIEQRNVRAAFGIDEPAVGLDDDVATGFGDIIVHYRQEP